MKSFYLIFIFVSMLNSSVFGKIITVDNNVSSGADFSTITDAINSASNGDTLYVHASNQAYGNVSISKKLILIGPGHYPQATGGLSAKLGKITFTDGSSGSMITGFAITGVIEKGGGNHVASDIIIENNLFTACHVINMERGVNDNWTIRGNIFIEDPFCGGSNIITVGKNSDDWLIANNIFISTSERHSTGIFGQLNGSTSIINNTIIHRNNAVLFYILSESNKSYNALLKNNIIVSLSSSLQDITSNCVDCRWENNLTFSPNTTLDPLPGASNINNKNPDFVSVSDTYAWSYDADFNVSAESPASNSGSDGTDLGAFGANFNFNIYGLPFGVPYIEKLEVENQLLHSGSKLRFRVKARSAMHRID